MFFTVSLPTKATPLQNVCNLRMSFICVTFFGWPLCLGRLAYGNELYWIIKLISKKRVITYIGTYGQTGKCCYKNR